MHKHSPRKSPYFGIQFSILFNTLLHDKSISSVTILHKTNFAVCMFSCCMVWLCFLLTLRLSKTLKPCWQILKIKYHIWQATKKGCYYYFLKSWGVRDKDFFFFCFTGVLSRNELSDRRGSATVPVLQMMHVLAHTLHFLWHCRLLRVYIHKQRCDGCWTG